MRQRRDGIRWPVIGAAVMALAACSSGTPGTGSPSAPVPTRSAVASGPTPTRVEARTIVVPVAAKTLPKTWREVFAIPYGRARERLGTSPGGEGDRLRFGPEYGAPAPDGTWWFLDTAKHRLAHYDAAGRFLDDVRVGPGTPVGRQWQLPHVLADGSLLAINLQAHGTELLRLRNGRVDETALDRAFVPAYDDGRLLYGHVGRRKLIVVDPATGDIRRTHTLLTPGGTPFLLVSDWDAGSVEISLGGIRQRLRFRSASGAVAHIGVRVAAGADGALDLFLVGYGNDDPRRQLVGFARFLPGSGIEEVEPFLDPFSDADPGNGGHLVLRPGSSLPMLVSVEPDGVHVYARP